MRMPEGLIIGFIVVFVIAGIASLHRDDDFVATVHMDGLGFYRLTNYEIDSEGCLLFSDFVDNPVHFCGGYSLTTMEEYRADYIDNLPPTIW